MINKVNIELREWDWMCEVGCCYNSGINIYVDGVKLEVEKESLIGVLNEFGYDIEIKETYEDK